MRCVPRKIDVVNENTVRDDFEIREKQKAQSRRRRRKNLFKNERSPLKFKTAPIQNKMRLINK